jgi:hypothetical protein
MAKSDKRRIAENARFIGRLQIGIAVSNALYVAVRLVLKNATCSTLNYVAFVMTTGLLYVTYAGLKSALEPAYDPYGQLIFAGSDLSQGGALSYYQDVAYLCMFALSLGAFSDYAWLVMLSIPLYAGFMVYKHILGPWMGSRNAGQAERLDHADEATKKRMAKKERQAARAEKFRR